MRADLEDALAAHDRQDWAAVLKGVRRLQGKAVVARGALEHRLGLPTVAADLPPLVRVLQAVGPLVSEEHIDSLPPDGLRVRLHAVLGALDHELRAFLGVNSRNGHAPGVGHD